MAHKTIALTTELRELRQPRALVASTQHNTLKDSVMVLVFNTCVSILPLGSGLGRGSCHCRWHTYFKLCVEICSAQLRPLAAARTSVHRRAPQTWHTQLTARRP